MAHHGKTGRGDKDGEEPAGLLCGRVPGSQPLAYFASSARKEGGEQIAAVFLETAANGKEHAKVFFKFLEGGEVEITSAYSAGVIKGAKTDLKAAADGEKHEWSVLYAEFERVVREEGFPDIADSFREIAEVERFHEDRYRKLLANIANGEVFRKKKPVKWRCRNCGHVYKGPEAPDVCPACRHPKVHYEILAETC